MNWYLRPHVQLSLFADSISTHTPYYEKTDLVFYALFEKLWTK